MLVGLMVSFASLAAASKIENVCWDIDRGEVSWDDFSDYAKKPTYRLTLYRGNRQRVAGPVKTQETMYSFAAVIADKGPGHYYASVEIVDVEGSLVTSPEFYADGTTVNALAKLSKEEAAARAAAEEAGKVGWISYPGNTWKYKLPDGSYQTGWSLINGKWYYFATNGVMLTGWQIVNNRWYCLAASGELYVNTVTPDGMTVNGNGECVVNGVPVDASWQPKNTEKNSARTLTELETIKLSSTETKVDPYVVRPMRVTSSGQFTVETYSFSKPYEQWTPGERIIVTCNLNAYTGYVFTDRTKVTINRGTIISNVGDSTTRTVTYAYYPRMVLASPANPYVDDGNVLHWAPVAKASKYIIKIMSEGEKIDDRTTPRTYFDLAEYIDEPDLSVEIIAIASESLRNYWYDSFATRLDDLNDYRSNGQIEAAGSRIRYYDDMGDPVQGWAELNGYWYHFTRGLSEAPGWYQDADAFWYYFDSASRMKTGWITDNGKRYFLNDGTIKDIPLGAWVEGL